MNILCKNKETVLIVNYVTNFKPGMVRNNRINLKNFILLIFFFKYLKKKINNIKFFKKSFFFIKKKKIAMFSFLKAPNRHKISQHQVKYQRYQIKWFLHIDNILSNAIASNEVCCYFLKYFLNFFSFFETTLANVETCQLFFTTKFSVIL